MQNNFTQPVMLTEPEPGRFQVEFCGVKYRPTDNTTAAGVLLFGLRPSGIAFSTDSDPGTFMFLAEKVGHTLHLIANGAEPIKERHPREDIDKWVKLAAALAPNEQVAAEVRRLVLENLGPNYAD